MIKKYFPIKFFSFCLFKFSFFLDLNNIVAIAHNIYNFVYNATGYPVTGQPDIQQMKPDIRPDTGYKKRPNIGYIPIYV